MAQARQSLRVRSEFKSRRPLSRAGALVQFSSVVQSCPTLCDPMNHSTIGLPVHHQLLGLMDPQRTSVVLVVSILNEQQISRNNQMQRAGGTHDSSNVNVITAICETDLGHPWWSSGQNSAFSLPRAWTQPRVGGLRSQEPQCAATPPHTPKKGMKPIYETSTEAGFFT